MFDLSAGEGEAHPMSMLYLGLAESRTHAEPDAPLFVFHHVTDVIVRLSAEGAVVTDGIGCDKVELVNLELRNLKLDGGIGRTIVHLGVVDAAYRVLIEIGSCQCIKERGLAQRAEELHGLVHTTHRQGAYTLIGTIGHNTDSRGVLLLVPVGGQVFLTFDGFSLVVCCLHDRGYAGEEVGIVGCFFGVATTASAVVVVIATGGERETHCCHDYRHEQPLKESFCLHNVLFFLMNYLFCF